MGEKALGTQQSSKRSYRFGSLVPVATRAGQQNVCAASSRKVEQAVKAKHGSMQRVVLATGEKLSGGGPVLSYRVAT